MTVRVWTLEYVPFIMGGAVHQPVATEVEPQGEYDLGKGFKGYLIVAPNGKTFVAEKTTGAFVGPTVEAVRKDIADCKDIELMEKQVVEAREKVKFSRIIPTKEFWKLLKAI